MAERAPHDLKVVGLNPPSGSYENVFSKLKSYCLLQDVTSYYYYEAKHT